MKKLFILSVLAGIAFSGSAQGVFEKGDKKMDLTIGVGTVAFKDKNRATFDQHFTMEWGVASIADKFTIGVGFAVNNMYGGKFESQTSGTFDYSYNIHTSGKLYDYASKKWKSFSDHTKGKRKGGGTADIDVAREDVDALAIGSLHYSPIINLDTYVRIGVGVGVMNVIYSNYRNLDGFKKVNEKNETNTNILKSTTTFQYDDLQHVKWTNKPKSKVVPSMAVYLGGTYYFTPNWGADLQIGVINANFKDWKKGYPNSFGVFAVGASYKF